MAVDLSMKRTVSGLSPADEPARDYLRHVPLGTVLACQVRKPRSRPHHRKFMALCTLVADNHETLTDKDIVKETLKILVNHVEVVQVGDTIIKIPKRISFDSMDQDEFNTFYRKCGDVICQHLLPGIDLADVHNEILRMI